MSIVGPGRVGMTLAYSLVLKGLVRELVLVGANHGKARGEAMDLNHSQSFLRVPIEVTAGGPSDVAGSQVIAICASVPMPEGLLDRNELVAGNARMMRELIPQLVAAAPEAMIVMLSNPVDVMTWQALQLSGLPPERVMGIGTLVDSARFREALSKELSIHADDLRSYVLGEHGSTQFPAMSLAQAGGEPLDDTPERRALFAETINAGVEVFKLKGHTCYAVAAAAAACIESILFDEKRTLPLSIRLEDLFGVSGVCLSVPVVIGKSGVERVLRPPLNEGELASFRKSAEAVRAVIVASGLEDG